MSDDCSFQPAFNLGLLILTLNADGNTVPHDSFQGQAAVSLDSLLQQDLDEVSVIVC